MYFQHPLTQINYCISEKAEVRCVVVCESRKQKAKSFSIFFLTVCRSGPTIVLLETGGLPIFSFVDDGIPKDVSLTQWTCMGIPLECNIYTSDYTQRVQAHTKYHTHVHPKHCDSHTPNIGTMFF